MHRHRFLAVVVALAGLGLVASAAAAARAESPAPARRSLWGGADEKGVFGPAARRLGTGDENPGLGLGRHDTGGLLGQSLAAVLIILALGGAAIFVVKRLLPRLGVTHGRRMSVVETVSLGARKSLHIVQAGDRTLLVSDTREHLSLVADLTGCVDLGEEDEPPLPAAPVRRRKPALAASLLGGPKES